MKKFVFVLMFTSLFSFSQDLVYEVTVQNITKSQIFAPPAVVVHNGDYQMFALGAAPSDALAVMAEDGNAGLIAEQAMEQDGVRSATVGSDPLMPGASMVMEIPAERGRNYISIAGMLVTTNDTFYAVSNISAPGTYFKRGNLISSHYAEAYDAGSELNTESCGDIPGPPCGNPGVRVTEGAEGFVHISSGIHGIADVSAAAYDWRGPVAIVTVRLTRN